MKLFLVLSLSLMASLSFAAPALEKEWTFMVFLNGDNNLYGASKTDIQEMIAAGSNSQINVLVLHDSGNKESSKILSITKEGSKVVFDYKKNIDTGKYENLIEFFKFAKQNYPAKKYLIDIWNHGNGWLDKGVLPSLDSEKGISYDDTSGNFISTAEIGLAMAQIKALNDGKNIEVLGMDACLMNMAEIVYEVHDSVNYVLGSEETEPDSGWDYTGVLTPLMKNPLMTTESFLTNAVSVYTNQYSSEATQSAISVSRFEKVIPLVNNFVDYAKSIIDANKKSFIYAKQKARSYDEKSYKDFINFLEVLVESMNKDQKLAQLSKELMTGLKNSVIANGQKGMPNSNGISVWIPTAPTKENSYLYEGLKWNTDTSWSSLIENF